MLLDAQVLLVQFGELLRVLLLFELFMLLCMNKFQLLLLFALSSQTCAIVLLPLLVAALICAT